MPKIAKTYRFDEKLVNAIHYLSLQNETSATNTLEVLIFREAMYKLSPAQLEHIFGDEYERLMLMYAVSKK